MKKLISAAVLGFSAAAFVPTAANAADPVHTGLFNNTAVGGWDAVSFHDGEGVEGSKKFSTTYNGAEFRFASAENLARFEEDPARYAPAYGGYCAWAIAQGNLAPGNPKNANVVDGVLYLNYNDSIEEKWLADVPGFIKKADQEWPEVLG
ncbi:YHS domain-containing (seleno)protein [Parvularcula maris]|uniref:YHS domain-containing protein n=1 Tax=Parvularcula maris TaxID=2965077 RepID=A0A9X2RJ07_9PROT|nr:YHS domain-containing (seleno)protein [Parvularcula maris]MCQ8185446.1 YHS domain-containing protein [Parvularcula maris]